MTTVTVPAPDTFSTQSKDPTHLLSQSINQSAPANNVSIAAGTSSAFPPSPLDLSVKIPIPLSTCRPTSNGTPSYISPNHSNTSRNYDDPVSNNNESGTNDHLQSEVSSEELLSLKLLHDRLSKTMELLLPEESSSKQPSSKSTQSTNSRKTVTPTSTPSKSSNYPSSTSVFNKVDDTNYPASFLNDESKSSAALKFLMSLLQQQQHQKESFPSHNNLFSSTDNHKDYSSFLSHLSQLKSSFSGSNSPNNFWQYWHEYLLSMYLLNQQQPSQSSSVSPSPGMLFPHLPPSLQPPAPSNLLFPPNNTPVFSSPHNNTQNILLQTMLSTLLQQSLPSYTNTNNILPPLPIPSIPIPNTSPQTPNINQLFHDYSSMFNKTHQKSAYNKVPPHPTNPTSSLLKDPSFFYNTPFNHHHHPSPSSNNHNNNNHNNNTGSGLPRSLSTTTAMAAKNKLLDSPESFGVSLRGNQKYSIYYQQRPNNIFNSANFIHHNNNSTSNNSNNNNNNNICSNSSGNINPGNSISNTSSIPLKSNCHSTNNSNNSNSNNNNNNNNNSGGGSSGGGYYKLNTNEEVKKCSKSLSSTLPQKHTTSVKPAGDHMGSASTKASPTPSTHSTSKYKETVFSCSCGREFENLYCFTVHLKATSHTASSGKLERIVPKLVRGQDMWINSETEQTKEILRCMRCHQSFRTLPDLTMHMVETNHYSEIVYNDTGKCLYLNAASHIDSVVKKEGTVVKDDALSPCSPLSIKRAHTAFSHIDPMTSDDEEPYISKIPRLSSSPPPILINENVKLCCDSKPENILQIKEADSGSDNQTIPDSESHVQPAKPLLKQPSDSVIRQIENFVEKSLPKSLKLTNADHFNVTNNTINITTTSSNHNNSHINSSNVPKQKSNKSVFTNINHMKNSIISNNSLDSQKETNCDNKLDSKTILSDMINTISSSSSINSLPATNNNTSSNNITNSNSNNNTNNNNNGDDNPLSSLQSLVETIQKNPVQQTIKEQKQVPMNYNNSNRSSSKSPSNNNNNNNSNNNNETSSNNVNNCNKTCKSDNLSDSLNQLQALVANTNLSTNNSNNNSNSCEKKLDSSSHTNNHNNHNISTLSPCNTPNHTNTNYNTSSNMMNWYAKLTELFNLSLPPPSSSSASTLSSDTLFDLAASSLLLMQAASFNTNNNNNNNNGDNNNNSVDDVVNNKSHEFIRSPSPFLDSDPLKQLKKLLNDSTSNNSNIKTSYSNNSNHSQTRNQSLASSNSNVSQTPQLSLNNTIRNSISPSNISKKSKCTFCQKPFANKGQVRLHISKGKCPSLLRNNIENANNGDNHNFSIPSSSSCASSSSTKPMLYSSSSSSSSSAAIPPQSFTSPLLYSQQDHYYKQITSSSTPSPASSIHQHKSAIITEPSSHPSHIHSNSTKSANMIREYFQFAKKMINQDNDKNNNRNNDNTNSDNDNINKINEIKDQDIKLEITSSSSLEIE